ncbi:formin-like protein 6 [Myripristis murdjan]|uniref:formin-like protein 6 n=1 Tax=Myripristis murdjan TaxID=586833 RepID=UPI0011761AF8|nr:formin-like protein 6 [Myripristis murdjan]
MMPSLGPKKKANLSRMDKHSTDLPQLSNEKQLSIMNMVKSGELSIEDALDLARNDQLQLFKQQSQAEEEQQQYNFSIHKHGRYRWQKRVLQIDFKTKMLCSIEKGIVKRQLPFSQVKSCEAGASSRFSISFKGRHDYELEATSLEDKHKIMQLVNQIIYENIYGHPADGNAETLHQSPGSKSLREGVLFLHRGGLASFKWVKYEVQLHPGQLTLVPLGRRGPADGEVTSTVTTVIHLSDGDTSVEKPHSLDTFTLATHKNKYHFRVPASEQAEDSKALQQERDAWVQAIHKLCLEWKRKSQIEDMHMGVMDLQGHDTDEDAEDTLPAGGQADVESRSSGGQVVDRNMNQSDPPAEYANSDPISFGGNRASAGDGSQSRPAAETVKPVAKLRIKSANIMPSSPVPSPAVPGPALSPPTTPLRSPRTTAFTPSSPLSSPTSPVRSVSSMVPQCPLPEPVSSTQAGPPPPMIPAPPPLPIRFKKNPTKPNTKAFHWDLVGSDTIAKSFWMQRSTRRIEIDTPRLYEQFAVQDLGTIGVADSGNTQHIILDQKIAHNFNIFLKSFPVQPGELKDKLFIVNEDDGGLSDEQITSLRRYVPTSDDVETYKSHQGPVSELHIVDQYMMEMCNIPCLSTQLDLLLTLRELPISMNDLQPLIDQKIRMCMQLCDSGSFVSVLEYILAIGNYLNENAGKEKAKGFRLSSLTKLCQLRGRDRKFTLLHALVEQIMLHEPCLVAFIQELAEFETVPGASIKGLTAEVDVLKNELQKVIQYKKTSKKRNGGDHHPNFSKDLKMAIDKYNADLSALMKKCEQMKKLFSDILVKFGEPANQDSRELFGLVCQFMHDFKRTHAEIV